MDIKEFPKSLQKIIKDFSLEAASISASSDRVFKLTSLNKTMFLKIGKEVFKEYEAYKFLEGKIPIPKIVYFGEENKLYFLLLEAIKGEMLCSENRLKEPERTIKLFVSALKTIWSIDYRTCNIDRGLNYKFEIAKKNIASGVCDYRLRTNLSEHFNSHKEALEYLIKNKPQEELVFSHGDFSLPNIFFEGDKLTGLIDVAECGVCCKWNDIAYGYRTIGKNFGSKMQEFYLKELGVEYDFRIDYYLLLLQLTRHVKEEKQLRNN